MLTKHHIIAKAEEGSNHPDNIKMLEQKPHRRLHDFFGNAMPHEQVDRILSIAHTAIHPEAIKEIKRVFDKWGLDLYKASVWKEQRGIYIPRSYEG